MVPSTKIVNGERTYLIEPLPKTEPSANGGVPGIVENHVKQDEPDQNNNENQRRPTIYIKRINTAPNDLRASVSQSPSTRSFSLISNYQAQQDCDVSVENEKRKEFAGGKRHTFPNSNERRISGNPGMGVFQRRVSGNVRISTDRRLTGNDRKRRTAFMNNNIKRYKQRLEETNRELEETIENMLLSKFE
mgnify:FL=1